MKTNRRNKTEEIVGSSVLILGYGVEGQSVHRWLEKFYPNVEITIADQRRIKPLPGSLRNVRVLRSFANFPKFDTIVRSPGIPIDLPALQKAKAAGAHITSATNIFFSVCPGKVIAVTGTKGKSTTASLIYQILSEAGSGGARGDPARAPAVPLSGTRTSERGGARQDPNSFYPDVRLVGNIGNPALDYLDGADKNTLFVIELSSYQLEDIRYGPHAAVILDVVPEHLDRYRDFNAYIAAKSNIVKFQTAKDYVVYNPKRKIPAKIASQSSGHKVCFSPNFPLPIPDVPLLGQGNRENCWAAITTAKILGAPSSAIRQALTNFKPLPHRLEKIGRYLGITFYDDSIATIPQATIHALNALGENVETLIAGGFDRGLDYTGLGKFLTKRKGLKNLILFPDTGEKIWQAVLAAAPKQKSPLHLMKLPVSSMKQAVRLAFAKTAKGKICLLSPASASYNLFKNFEARGREFKKQVNKCYYL